jgi:hypothetical protein
MAERKAVLPLEWHVPESLECQYATNLVVQHTDHEFIISFFKVAPPLVVGEPEEVKAQLEQVESVRAECVAQVIVAAGRMPEFVDAFQRNLEGYRTRLEEREE